MRRRGFAMALALVFLMELALLCCAYQHAPEPLAHGSHCCEICRFVRLASLALPALILALALALRFAPLLPRRVHPLRAALFTPLTLRKVRLND